MNLIEKVGALFLYALVIGMVYIAAELIHSLKNPDYESYNDR